MLTLTLCYSDSAGSKKKESRSKLIVSLCKTCMLNQAHYFKKSLKLTEHMLILS